MGVLVSVPPCVLHEDSDLLVVNKPSSWNTHSPNPYHGEGIHEWLKHREPRWAHLAIIHRLDKPTSGVLVFAKTVQANRSLTEQFATRKTQKIYLLLSHKSMPKENLVVRDHLKRVGEKYFSAPAGEQAETHFEAKGRFGDYFLIEAQPLTGRTHQIRVHASENGFPIVGDLVYGGIPFRRLCLHAQRLELYHPSSRQRLSFSVDAHFEQNPGAAYRNAFLDENTIAYRLINGAADDFPGVYLERWGDYLLLSSETEPPQQVSKRIEEIAADLNSKGIYIKKLNRKLRGTTIEEAAPRHLSGIAAPDTFLIMENGVRYEASFSQGYSAGLFLDQRDNRRRLLTSHVAGKFPELTLKGAEILNTFSYTCGFSLCAAIAGARSTSLDLSKKYLDWGRRNFEVNGIDPALHDFIYGDVFDWADRLAKKGRKFDVIILDPPTFSQAKTSGIFQAEKHYQKLTAALLPLLKKPGVLFASTNAQKYQPDKFMNDLRTAFGAARRPATQFHYVPQPPDFPVAKEEPAYLKTAWFHLA